MAINTQKHERFIELRVEGHSYEKIALELEVSKGTLIKWGKDLSLEIGNLKELRREALNERHMLGLEARLAEFSAIKNRLAAELQKRDFADVTTDKLIRLYCELNAEAESLSAPPKLREKTEMPLMDFSTEVCWDG